VTAPPLPWHLVETDSALIPMIARMEDVGILCNPDYFKDLSVYITDLRNSLDDQIRGLGGPQNPGAPDQVASWLYQRLGTRLTKKQFTPTGKISTKDKYLEAALKASYTRPEQRHALKLVLDRREVEKLRGTYVDPMPDLLGPDSRLHPNVLYTRTDTGRLATKSWRDDDGDKQGANLMAFPKHSDLGILVRHGFVPKSGCVLGEWDLKQIEMKEMAIESGDERMIAQMLSGVDFHQMTAAEVIFNKPLDAVTKDDRFQAKAVNFGILMGMTGKGLQEDLAKKGQFKTVDECTEFIANWMKGYPGCASYIAAAHAEARRFGYVTNWRGRRRWLPAVHSPNSDVSLGAERQAQATKIQGGAQEITKLWMIEVWRRVCELRKSGVYVELLLQVHDSLLFELEEWAYDLLDGLMREALDAVQERFKFVVPLACDGASGMTWGEL
jgi:DNA polymerase I